MKIESVRQFPFKALFIPAVLTLASCDKSMELQEIAQCVAPITNAGEAGIPPNGFELLAERQCYGLKWSMPLAYEPYLFGTPVENLNITMGLQDHTPGAHMTDVRKAREQPQISIYPQLGNEFQERVLAIKTAAEETYGLQSTGRLMYGMEVLETKPSAAGARMIMFYPVDSGTSMVACTIGAILGDGEIDPLTLCSVTSYIDAQLYAEYNILYSLMPDFQWSDTMLINNINAFRVR